MIQPEIHEPRTAQDLNAVRQLCWDYRDVLLGLPARTSRLIQHFYPRDKYAAILADLEALHARPNGIILLAKLDGQPVACGMSHRLSDTASEIKRLYVAPAARGTGLGRTICNRLLEQARADGFRTVYLDTSRDLPVACALYTAMGFQDRGPYQEVPDTAKDVLRFFEMSL